MENQKSEIEKAERLKDYLAAFAEVWAERSRGNINHSVEATVEGPLKIADMIVDAYFDGLS